MMIGIKKVEAGWVDRYQDVHFPFSGTLSAEPLLAETGQSLQWARKKMFNSAPRSRLGGSVREF